MVKWLYKSNDIVLVASALLHLEVVLTWVKLVGLSNWPVQALIQYKATGLIHRRCVMDVYDPCIPLFVLAPMSWGGASSYVLLLGWTTEQRCACSSCIYSSCCIIFSVSLCTAWTSKVHSTETHWRERDEWILCLPKDSPKIMEWNTSWKITLNKWIKLSLCKTT